MKATKTTTRSLSTIAAEIHEDWTATSKDGKIYFGAVPYLEVMFSLDNIDQNYGFDSGRSIVAYFISNASTWRGPKAREIKAELNKMIK